jgi:hypothetical protein
MQTPEKVNRQFVFKLLVLFSLLMSGAMLKTPKQKADSFESSDSSTNPVVQKEYQQIQQLYNRLVSQDYSTAASI